MTGIETFNWQAIINITLGVIVFFGGWMLKVIFGLMNKMQEDYRKLNDNALADYKKMHEDLTALALSIPEKYLRKDDFINFAERMDERFDKLEEKIDQMR
tara:strand:- start:1222 stop:1521 length:300 start_codon:yes stop_codon:yes gene_type:complete